MENLLRLGQVHFIFEHFLFWEPSNLRVLKSFKAPQKDPSSGLFSKNSQKKFQKLVRKNKQNIGKSLKFDPGLDCKIIFLGRRLANPVQANLRQDTYRPNILEKKTIKTTQSQKNR
jgi:hypothetical protein